MEDRFRQGYVAAIKKMENGSYKDCYALRFDRKDPQGKSKSWYVYLMLGQVPPQVGDLVKFKPGELEQVDSIGKGMDTYRVKPAKTHSNGKEWKNVKIDTLATPEGIEKNVEVEPITPKQQEEAAKAVEEWTPEPDPHTLMLTAATLLAPVAEGSSGPVPVRQAVETARAIWKEIHK